MQKVFKAIEPQLKLYRNHKSLTYLDQTILSNLDKTVYHPSYKLHKYKTTPMQSLIQMS